MLDHQVTSYLYGVAYKLKIKLAGIFVNALRKPNKNAKFPQPEFLRETVTITPDHIRNMLMSFTYTANDIESRDTTNMDDWPQNPQRCFDYGRCPFWSICASGANAEPDGFLFIERERDYTERDTPVEV